MVIIIQLYIYTSDYKYSPVTAGGISLTLERAGAPGKLSFRVVKDQIISFHEGDMVTLHSGEINVFRGYVFKKQRDSDGTINVLAYDQLRYFKNKDTYTYSYLTASEIISRIAADCRVVCGGFAGTGYQIESRVESGKSLMDIAQTAIELTFEATGRLYVLFDEYGALRLQNVEDMAYDLLIHAGAANDFDYTSSIDDETYTSIKLEYDDGDTGETTFYCASSQELISRWGKLQYYGKVDSGDSGAAIAKSLLKIYGVKTRKLKVNGVIGDVQVRAGCLLPVQMDLGDLDYNSFLMAEKVVHTFMDDIHTMDITLVGGEFVA